MQITINNNNSISEQSIGYGVMHDFETTLNTTLSKCMHYTSDYIVFTVYYM